MDTTNELFEQEAANLQFLSQAKPLSHWPRDPFQKRCRVEDVHSRAKAPMLLEQEYGFLGKM